MAEPVEFKWSKQGYNEVKRMASTAALGRQHAERIAAQQRAKGLKADARDRSMRWRGWAHPQCVVDISGGGGGRA